MSRRETYDELRERHEKELREWVQNAVAGGKSVNSASRDENVNVGTLWRLVERYGRGN